MDRTLAQILRESAARLASLSETPRLDAELLLGRALNLSRASLLARLQQKASDLSADMSLFEALLVRRLNYEPLAYIFGEWEFYGLPFYVEAPMLTPRPETEDLVSRALEFLNSSSDPCRIVDVGCGTGCIVLSVARHAPRHEFYAIDIRQEALALTRRNAQRHNIFLRLIQGDMLTAFDSNTPCFDLILSNPPYVPEEEWEHLSPVITRHEDPGALLAGKDGLDCYRQLIPQAATLLKPGGALLLESGENQHAPLQKLLAQAGFISIQSAQDLAGHDRILSARKPL